VPPQVDFEGGVTFYLEVGGNEIAVRRRFGEVLFPDASSMIAEMNAGLSFVDRYVQDHSVEIDMICRRSLLLRKALGELPSLEVCSAFKVTPEKRLILLIRFANHVHRVEVDRSLACEQGTVIHEGPEQAATRSVLGRMMALDHVQAHQDELASRGFQLNAEVQHAQDPFVPVRILEQNGTILEVLSPAQARLDGNVVVPARKEGLLLVASVSPTKTMTYVPDSDLRSLLEAYVRDGSEELENCFRVATLRKKVEDNLQARVLVVEDEARLDPKLLAAAIVGTPRAVQAGAEFEVVHEGRRRNVHLGFFGFSAEYDAASGEHCESLEGQPGSYTLPGNTLGRS